MTTVKELALQLEELKVIVGEKHALAEELVSQAMESIAAMSALLAQRMAELDEKLEATAKIQSSVLMGFGELSLKLGFLSEWVYGLMEPHERNKLDENYAKARIDLLREMSRLYGISVVEDVYGNITVENGGSGDEAAVEPVAGSNQATGDNVASDANPAL